MEEPAPTTPIDRAELQRVARQLPTKQIEGVDKPYDFGHEVRRVLFHFDALEQRIAALEGEVALLADADGALRELYAQIERWKIPMPVRGDPRAPALWALKLIEEVGEVAAALLGEALGKEGRGDVRQELDQVIACAIAARIALAPEADA